MTADEYKFICWLGGKTPKAKIVRDLLRAERNKGGTSPPKGGDK